LNLEIKPTPGDEVRTGTLVALAARGLWADAVAAGRSAWPLLSSFRPEALAAAFEAAPELPRALLLDSLWGDCFEVARRLGCGAVVLNHHLLNGPAPIRALQADGLQVLVYTVNDPARAAELLEWGVRGVITDAVERCLPD
jgi:glycerophosphoryl diester phosphodiesterase